MPFEVIFENDRAGALLVARGHIAEGELLAANEKMYAGVNLKTFRYQILDLTDVAEQENIPIAKLEQLIKMDKEAAKESQGFLVAIVVSRGLLESLSEVYSMYVKDYNLKTKLFNRIDEAREWIKDVLPID